MKEILIIEDNAEMRENIAEILEMAQYRVTTAENGKVGVRQAQAKRPDLIISDIMMPELDGYGVLHILSKDAETAGIPFIFLTAKSEKTDYRKGMSLGADDYLTKPFDDTELLNAVEIRLRKSEAVRSGGNGSNSFEVVSNLFNKAKSLEELNKLSDIQEPRHYKKREIIYKENSYPAGIFLVQSGNIKIFKANEDGKEFITDVKASGEFFGYTALLEERAYADSAAALEDAEVCFIPKQDFFHLIYRNRDVAHQFIKLLSNDLKDKEDRLLRLAYHSVRKRVAEALVMLMERYGSRNNGAQEQISFSIAREDLAGIIGTAPETVIRTLSDFKEEKLISITSGKITILDAKKLKYLHG
jgi:CRP-like cAMP-binding protein/CheY-like chemotaxis protein